MTLIEVAFWIAFGLALLALAAITLLGGCAEHYDGPKPVLAPPDKYWDYYHWTCPPGYSVHTGIRRLNLKIVYCESKENVAKDQETWERSYTPKGREPQ